MLNDKPEQQILQVGLPPKNITVPFADGPKEELAVVLPPVGNLSRSDGLDIGPTSISNVLAAKSLENSHLYGKEYFRLQAKYGRFKSSHTYLSHLADLGLLAGKMEDAEYYLNAAMQVSRESFLHIQMSTVLIRGNKDSHALSILSQCDLDEDLEANLWMAHIMIRSNRMEEARAYVVRALDIDNGNYKAQMFYGALCLWREDWKQAVRCFRVAMETKNDSSTLYANLAAAYWGLGEKEKTIQTLRKSIYLDPTNENANLFLADVMLIMGRPKGCITQLETILSYVQDNDFLWGRAAKVFYELGISESGDRSLFQKALDALFIQLKLVDSADVLNNIGVVYSALENKVKAHRYFAQALVKARELQEEDGIPFSNYLGELFRLEMYEKVVRQSTEYLESRTAKVNPKIYVHYMASMEELGRRSEAADEAIRVLDSCVTDDETDVELISYILYSKSLIDPDPEIIVHYVSRLEQILNRNRELSDKLYCRAINNLVFALLKICNFDRARNFLGKLGRWVHIDPYATATLGLYHLGRGGVDRARALYDEAISLSLDSSSKSKVRQRMYIEFGRYHFENGDQMLSKKFLRRALKQKSGHEYAEAEARSLLLACKNI